MKNGSFGKFIEAAKPKLICLNETKIDPEALEKEGVIGQMEKYGFPRGL